MEFAWLGLSAGGALPPQLALCEALMGAGHRVRAVVDPDAVARVEAAGIPAEATTRPPFPADLAGPDREAWVYANMFMGPTYNSDLRRAVERWKPDRLLLDGMLYDAHVEAHSTDIPYAAIGHILVGAAFGGPTAARLDQDHLERHNDHRRRVGLEPVATVRDTLLDADWFLAMTYADLDAPDARTWPRLHYVGAHVPSWTPVALELPAGDAPLVVVAFSTTPMGQDSVVQRVLDGLGNLDVRVLVTTGPAMRSSDLDLPANATTQPYVPHDQILPEAALMVSHVGHGSMAAAARHGVPILALPMGRDQDRNAEVLAQHGIGITLDPTAEPDQITAAASALLTDETIGRTATQMAQTIANHPGLAEAIELLTQPAPPRASP